MEYPECLMLSEGWILAENDDDLAKAVSLTDDFA